MTSRSLQLARLVFLGTSITIASPVIRSARAQVGTVCTCDDVYELINRLNMAEASRAALLEELPNIEARDRANSPKPPSLLDDRNANGVSNQDIVRNAIGMGTYAVQMPGASVSGAETKGNCAASMVKRTKACMDEIVMWHEEHVHVPACSKGRKNALGFRAPVTTVEYVKEEIAGYEAEIQRIKEILRMLPASCRPSGWIGHIQYSEERTMEARNATGSERTSQTMTRVAKVLYREAGAAATLTAVVQSPRAATSLKDKVTRYETKSGKGSCTGGLGTRGPERSITVTMQEDLVAGADGENDIDVSFEYDSQTGSYSLSFELPRLAGKGTLTRTETVRGSCDPSADGTKTSSSGFSQSYDGYRVFVSGTVTPQSEVDVLRGSDKIELGPRVTMPNMVMTHSGTVRWTFHKLP